MTEKRNNQPDKRTGRNHFMNESQSTPKRSTPPNRPNPDEIEWHPKAWTWMAGLLIVAIAILSFAFFQYQRVASTLNSTYSGAKNSRDVAKVIKQRKPFTVLLMGTDTGELGRTDKGRTDSMILATVNPNTKKTTFTSIPRDTKVVVPGDSQPYEKINAAYTIGGADTATEVVHKLFNVPVDFYAVVNMKGIKQMVNAVGGVDITPNLTFDYEGISVKKGKTEHMNGQTALQYSRMRYQDPLGDYGRQIRQRQVLNAILQKGLTIGNVGRYGEILNSLKGNLQTDLSFDDMVTIAGSYKDATKNLQQTALQCDNAMVDGLSYQVASDKELLKVSNQIRQSLDLPTESQLTPTQRKVNSNEEDGEDGSFFNSDDSVNNNNELPKN
ncbi:LCP family protein [Fructilactobacillus cliffordii]|uniref:LCP family glycopolymer transferase n=1 Tax=Fructilactobacillus cliffordii TaxID=2940299 RepID=UPI002092B042|nr:LCP family protein [Fructilactobacillus cliffordii]USS87019.1 LCP family protein [Fructilactobacillus cliffordii]